MFLLGHDVWCKTVHLRIGQVNVEVSDKKLPSNIEIGSHLQRIPWVKKRSLEQASQNDKFIVWWTEDSIYLVRFKAPPTK